MISLQLTISEKDLVETHDLDGNIDQFGFGFAAMVLSYCQHYRAGPQKNVRHFGKNIRQRLGIFAVLWSCTNYGSCVYMLELQHRSSQLT